jgi:putative thiamine transport system ATP-binding protein
MLVCRNLSVERDGRLLFQPFSIQVAAGQVLTLEGPSGLGKSTLLGALVGPLPGISLSGDVHLHGLTWSSVLSRQGGLRWSFKSRACSRIYPLARMLRSD